MVNTLQVDGLAHIPGHDKDHICRIPRHRTAFPHVLYDVFVLDGGRGKTMNDLVDQRSRTARQQSCTKQSIAENTDTYMCTYIKVQHNNTKKTRTTYVMLALASTTSLACAQSPLVGVFRYF